MLSRRFPGSLKTQVCRRIKYMCFKSRAPSVIRYQPSLWRVGWEQPFCRTGVKFTPPPFHQSKKTTGKQRSAPSGEGVLLKGAISSPHPLWWSKEHFTGTLLRCFIGGTGSLGKFGGTYSKGTQTPLSMIRLLSSPRVSGKKYCGR